VSDATVKGYVDASFEIPVVDDWMEALALARDERRVILAEEGRQPVVVLPLVDLQLLLRREEMELDRIDAEELAREALDPDNQELIAWEDVKASVGS
jgi:hypothetical protein